MLSAVVLQCLLAGYSSAFLLSLLPLEEHTASWAFSWDWHLQSGSFFSWIDYFVGLHAHKDAIHISGYAKMLSEGIDFRMFSALHFEVTCSPDLSPVSYRHFYLLVQISISRQFFCQWNSIIADFIRVLSPHSIKFSLACIKLYSLHSAVYMCFAYIS